MFGILKFWFYNLEANFKTVFKPNIANCVTKRDSFYKLTVIKIYLWTEQWQEWLHSLVRTHCINNNDSHSNEWNVIQNPTLPKQLWLFGVIINHWWWRSVLETVSMDARSLFSWPATIENVIVEIHHNWTKARLFNQFSVRFKFI